MDLRLIPRFLRISVDAVDKYAEEVFQSLDKVISIAKELSLRVVIPLIDGSPDAETGGVGAFAALRGLPPAAFYSDPGLRRDWKKVVSYFMNRVNNVTGKPYKLEPAIAAWQLGSNLDTQNRSALEDWAMDMASFIKAEDPNHLLWDGSVTSQWSAKYAAHPSIDGFTTSYSGSTVKVPPVDSNLLLGLQIALFFFGASGILLSVSPKWVKSLKEQKGFSSRKSILLLIFNALVFAASTVAFGMLTATAVRTTTSQQNIFQDVTLPLRFNKSSVVSRFEMMDVKTLKGFCTDLITSGAAGGFLGELTFRREQGGFCKCIIRSSGMCRRRLIERGIRHRCETTQRRLVELLLAGYRAKCNERLSQRQLGNSGCSEVLCWHAGRSRLCVFSVGTGATNDLAVFAVWWLAFPGVRWRTLLHCAKKLGLWDFGGKRDVGQCTVKPDRKRIAHERRRLG